MPVATETAAGMFALDSYRGRVRVLSFNNSFTITFPWRGFTLDWYKEALGNTEFVKSLLNSSAVGICTAVISTVVGTMAALAVRRGFRFQGLVLNLMFLPMVTPPLVAGFALFMMSAANDTLQQWPVSMRVNSARADDFDATLIDIV